MQTATPTIVSHVPTYLVEFYLPGHDRAWLEELLNKFQNQGDVRYLGSLYVPGDESCFCRFDARDAESVREASARVGVPFARIVAFTELGIS